MRESDMRERIEELEKEMAEIRTFLGERPSTEDDPLYGLPRLQSVEREERHPNERGEDQ